MKHTARIAALGAAAVMIAFLAGCPMDSPYQLPPEKAAPSIIGTRRTQDDDFNGLTLASTDDSFNPNSGLVIDTVQELKVYILKAQENPKFFTDKPSHWVKDK